MGEQEPDVRVVLRARGLLERRERVVRPPGVHGGEPQPLQERRVVRRLGQPLAKQQPGFVRSPLAERLPSPALEAADDVLAPSRAPRVVGRGAAELLARSWELPGGVQTDGFLGQRARIPGAGGGKHHGSLDVDGLVAPPFPPAKEQSRDAEDRRGKGQESDVAGGCHARAQRAGSIRNRD